VVDGHAGGMTRERASGCLEVREAGRQPLAAVGRPQLEAEKVTGILLPRALSTKGVLSPFASGAAHKRCLSPFIHAGGKYQRLQRTAAIRDYLLSSLKSNVFGPSFTFLLNFDFSLYLAGIGRGASALV